MTKNRYVGIDSGKGFGIFMMIFIHIILHQIGQWDMGFLNSIIKDAPLYLLILLTPIGIFSLLGTAFLFCNAVSVSVQMLRLTTQKSNKFSGVLIQRSLTGVLYITLFRLGRSLIQTDYFKAGYFYFPKIWVRFAADTVDSIAISAVILSFIFFFLSRILRIHHPKPIFWIFIGLTIIWFIISDPLVIWGQRTVNIFQAQELFFIKFLLTKFATGRFKLFQTLGFGFLGSCFGCLLEMDVSKRVLGWFATIITIISIIVLILWIVIDPSFLQHVVSEDVPLPLQILTLGPESLLLLYFVFHCDYGPLEKQLQYAKRMTWLRRYALVSLTLYAVHDTVNNQIYKVLVAFWGPALDKTGETPIIAWNSIQIIICVILTILIWELLLRLWEKVEFKYSLEWFLSRILLLYTKNQKERVPVKNLIYGLASEPIRPSILQDRSSSENN